MARFQFTAANAREMAAKSAQARRRLPLEPVQPTVAAGELADPIPDYHSKRLTRVRVQLNTLDSRLEDEMRRTRPDARKIKELVDAQIRLSEQERILAGRPLPGSHRPIKPRADRPQTPQEPSEPSETTQ